MPDNTSESYRYLRAVVGGTVFAGSLVLPPIPHQLNMVQAYRSTYWLHHPPSTLLA
jgi:hypothetical protein